MNRLFYFTLFFIVLISNVYTNSLDKEFNKYNKLEFQPIKAKVPVKTVPIKANNPNYKSLPAIGDQSESRDCEGCEFDYSAYGTECCDSAWEEFLITCAELESIYGWDCSGCECPGDGSDICGDGNCTGDEDYYNCPADCSTPGECDAGYVTDCVDDDCCPETWIGDGFEDCEDQAYGCDLTCYDNDGGDCGPACPDGEVECWDGSCAASDDDCPLTCEEQGGTICWDGSCAIGEDCPDAGCSESGGIESWIADGYCDGSNNNANCDWDGGDCCGSTCINNTYDCNSTTTGPCVNECLDPNANDDCCTDNSCPFTCEANELITCWDGSCAENETECPDADCSDTPCSWYLSTYTCPQIEELYGYDCSICEEEGACPITCEDEGLITCPTTGQCVNSEDECNTCENPDEAVEGINNSDGYDQYYTFSVTQGGFLTLSSAGAGIDTKLYLYATCEDVDIVNYPYGDYVGYNDDWGSSQFGECPDCDYWGESYVYVGVPAGDYIIVSSDQYNSAHVPFSWTLSFDLGVEGCTNPEATNYNPEANIDDGSCEFADGIFFITCDGGSYQTEVSWDLMNVNDDGLEDIIVLSGGAPFNGVATLDPGDYYLSAIDSWGDGWNGNIWTIIDDESNEILSYTLEEGNEGASEIFTIEGGCDAGDVNGDGILNILDVLEIVNAINTGDTTDVLECGDVNGDGILNILDVVAIINLILG